MRSRGRWRATSAPSAARWRGGDHEPARPTATIGELNALLDRHDAGLVAVLWFAADGAPLGGRQFGTSFDGYGLSVAADAGGGALIAGHTAGTTDLVGPGLGGFGDDAFVARIFP